MVQQSGFQGEVLRGCGAEGWWLGLGTTLDRATLLQTVGSSASFSPYFTAFPARSLTHYEVPVMGLCIVMTSETRGPMTEQLSYCQVHHLVCSVVSSLPRLHRVTLR